MTSVIGVVAAKAESDIRMTMTEDDTVVNPGLCLERQVRS